jgi:RHS repeat-associated protein
MAVTEMYSYHPAGGVTAKQLQLGCEILDDASGQCQTWQAEADYTYNANGQVQSYGSKLWNISDYFPGWLPETIYTYTYGAWGKPVSLTDNAWASNGYGQNTVWAQNAAYDFAGHLTSVQANMGYQYYAYSDTYAQLFLTKAETWNVNGQMTGMNFTAPAGNVYGIQYNYSSAQNNGQIASKTDTVAGVTVAYQYDQLKRLISTSSTPNAGSTPAAWIESFGYDGFGNLTSKVLNGNTTPIPANAATNRLTNATYDANGNMWSGAGATMTYDAANRMTSATEVSGGTEYYGYAPDNKRILRVSPTGAMFITLYGAFGEKLGQYQNTSALGNNVWFGGQLIGLATPSGMQIVQTDRLGSVLTQFYPYGETLGSGGTPSTVGYDSLLFATYTRDSFTGLDYADQRMYASLYGRFNSPDPYQASASGSSNPRRPQSWNRYSYVLGDPINFYDPQGLFALQSGNGTDDCPPGMVFYNNGCVVAVNDGAGKGMPNGGGGGGGGAAAAPPCGPSNPSGVTLTAAQQSLLGGTSFTALSTPQELVFLVITADASQLGLNLSGYTLGSVQIAGQGASQTELNLTAANGLSSLNALTGSFGGAGIVTAPPDPMHGIYNSGNWRQAVPQWSMQVTSAASGNIQVDIDPYNPNFGGFGSWLGHAGNVIGNTLTGGDTNYLNVASALQARYPGLKIFNCP